MITDKKHISLTDDLIKDPKFPRILREADAIVSDTPVSDKYNLSLKSRGSENYERWVYEIALFLDKIVPIQGYTNAQRIEIALNEIIRQYKKMIETRDIKPESLTSDLIADNRFPRIRSEADVNHLIDDYEKAMNIKAPLGYRIKKFIAGESKLGRKAGAVVDFITVFMPFGNKIDKARDMIRTVQGRRQKFDIKDTDNKYAIAILAIIAILTIILT